MNEHEDGLITAFIAKEKQARFRFLLASNDTKRRGECLNRLNHCRDLNEKYVTWLPRDPRSTNRNAEIAAMLREKGSPKLAYVFGGSDSADSTTMPLLEALDAVTDAGWGAIISCVPGELAYYYDEEGERRAILQRKPGA